jgi:DNA-binding XRE family transcriptional regulator
MNLEGKATALAVSVVVARIFHLSKEDRDDLFALVKEMPSAKTEADILDIVATMTEILEGDCVKVHRADLAESTDQPDNWKHWTRWVSGKIRDARNEAGITQEQLAERSGLPQSHISRIENAKHSPSRATIEKIAKALAKPVSFFDFN